MLSRIIRVAAPKGPSRGLKTPGLLLGVRLYSEKNKYRNIDEFNKFKTDFTFDTKIDEGDSHGSSVDTKELHSKVAENMRSEQQRDINDIIESDPRLQALDHGSPEYKEMLLQVNQEFQQRQRKEQQKYESRERWKAVGFGVVIIVGIVSLHQFLFHYQWYKAYLFKNSYDVDDEKKSKPKKKNTKNMSYLQEKLEPEISAAFITDLLHSQENAGLYVSGSFNGKKIPTRIKYFDHMLLRDVKISDNVLVAINDKGKAFYYDSKQEKPQQLNLSAKVEKCQISKLFIYFLTTSGQVHYIPRQAPSQSSWKRSWLGLKHVTDSSLEFNFQRGERIEDVKAGASHLLMLSNKGRLFTVKTCDGDNYGQYGLPTLAPVSNPVIPNNEVFELTNLNNELVIKGTEKAIRPRAFTAIASGSFHNLAADSAGDIWTWGKNSFGQCGVDVNFKSDVQVIPNRVVMQKDLSTALGEKILGVDQLFANEETSFVQVRTESGQSLLSFGNGLKGQLGINRFLHLSHTPLVIKSLKLKEFNEAAGKVQSIGFDGITAGQNHTIVTLDNSGASKDILVFGDNEQGQFGNSKLVKSSKPISIPNLVEPTDIEEIETKRDVAMKKLAKKVHDPDNRLSLNSELKIKGYDVKQVIQATGTNTAIYYKRK